MKQILGSIFLLAILNMQNVHAKILKVGTLTPEGTTWSNNLKEMAKEIKAATNGEVELKPFMGGVSGDEPDVLRKIRVGQMQGGIFTGRTLGEINGDVRTMELPFNFKLDRTKAINTLNLMTPYYNKGFEKKGFINLGFFEVGQVYLVSTKKAKGLDDLKGLKIWSWEGDTLVSTMVESLKLVSVPLALPDVLASLSTGVIDAAYSSPLGILALQWQTKIKYLLDFPVAYSVAAFLISEKEWAKIKPEHQKMILSISNKFAAKSNEVTAKENEDALVALKKMGVEFVKFPESDLKKSDSIRADVIGKLKGKLFTNETLSLINKEIGK